ncbi:MAG: type VI secretion system protein TssA [Planctomycetes bacterium]|nr:type VI secretion system protein TssA [Planctomycetota bacterium]
MPTPDLFDFPKMLAPIPGENPTGVDLRGSAAVDSPYYLVKDARSAARAAERRIEGGDDEAPTPEWKPVVQAAIKATQEVTKDLEIIAYLIEALARTNGFAGLRDGFRLARGLIEAFWDNLYPKPDEEGILTRVAPISGLNGDDAEGTLIAPIRRIPLTDSSNHGRFSFADYQLAVATGKILDPKIKEKKVASGALTMERFQQAVDDTATPAFRILFDDLQQAIDEYAKLGTALDQKCGRQAPPSSAIRDMLLTVKSAVQDVGRLKLVVAAAPVIEKAAEGDSGGKAAVEEKDGPPGEKLGVLRDREDALNALVKIGDFFRRTEPHTIVSFALDQVVRWGRMPLPDLILELIPDEGPRKALFKQVGIRLPEPVKPEKAEKK